MSVPIGSTLGIDNWPGRWAEKAGVLAGIKWPHFRSNSQLMHGIQTGAHRFDMWYQRVKDAGIKPHYFEDSRYGDPTGDHVDGVFATANSLRMAYYAHAIAEYWQSSGEFSVLDIGAGYGGMALALRKRFGQRFAAYFTLDHEVCLQIQARYTKSAAGLAAVPWDGQGFDLAISTNSLGEMDPDDVSRYFAILKGYMREGGALYSMNRLERVTDFRLYPYGSGWRHQLIRHPFGEEDWAECLSIRDSAADEPHPAKALG